MEKYIEDAKQDEKHVPDLLESIMRPTDPVKEELTVNGLKTRLKQKNIFHPSSQAPAQAWARSPGPGPGPCEEGWKT